MNLSSDDCDEQELTRGVRNKFFKNLNIHIANYIYDTIIYNLRLFIYRYKLKRDIKFELKPEIHCQMEQTLTFFYEFMVITGQKLIFGEPLTPKQIRNPFKGNFFHGQILYFLYILLKGTNGYLYDR